MKTLERQEDPYNAGRQECGLAELIWKAIRPFVATNLNVHLMKKFYF